jgi:MarR family transcriptional regulator for hemolysin
VLKYDFEESLGYWLAMTTRACERAMSAELAPHGFTLRQWQVLAWLVLEGELSQVELAERMGLEPATLVGILDRMERAGWIARKAWLGDRRKNLIVPTAEAEPVWAKLAACARRVRRRAAHGISPRQLRQLKSLLGLVQENLGPAAAVPARNGSHA